VYIINWYKTVSATESQDNIKQWNKLSKSEKWLDLRLHRRSIDDTLHVEEAMKMSRIKTKLKRAIANCIGEVHAWTI